MRVYDLSIMLSQYLYKCCQLQCDCSLNVMLGSHVSHFGNSGYAFVKKACVRCH